MNEKKKEKQETRNNTETITNQSNYLSVYDVGRCWLTKSTSFAEFLIQQRRSNKTANRTIIVGSNQNSMRVKKPID